MINYKAYLRSPEWRSLANRVKERDNYRCVLCGSKDNLEVHHTTYDRIGHEDMDDLITLCSKCHKIVTIGKRLGKFLKWTWRQLTK